MSESSSQSSQFLDELNEFLALPEPTSANVPQELIWHVAAGLEEPEDIAKRFGYEGDTWDRLRAHPPFQIAVKALQAEFELTGFTFKNKNRLMAGHMLEKLFVMANSPDASIGQVHEALRTFAKFADLEPKQEKAVADTGAKFSININLPGASQPATIDITPTQIEEG
jgi:hypothetical protein